MLFVIGLNQQLGPLDDLTVVLLLLQDLLRPSFVLRELLLRKFDRLEGRVFDRGDARSLDIRCHGRLLRRFALVATLATLLLLFACAGYFTLGFGASAVEKPSFIIDVAIGSAHHVAIVATYASLLATLAHDIAALRFDRSLQLGCSIELLSALFLFGLLDDDGIAALVALRHLA